jgi:hypothetical protein
VDLALKRGYQQNLKVMRAMSQLKGEGGRFAARQAQGLE